MSGAAAWAAWFALALSLLLLATVAGVVVLVLRFWRKVEPTVAPMLAMFAPASATSSLEAGVVAAVEAEERDGGARPWEPAP